MVCDGVSRQREDIISALKKKKNRSVLDAFFDTWLPHNDHNVLANNNYHIPMRLLSRAKPSLGKKKLGFSDLAEVLWKWN